MILLCSVCSNFIISVREFRRRRLKQCLHIKYISLMCLRMCVLIDFSNTKIALPVWVFLFGEISRAGDDGNFIVTLHRNCVCVGFLVCIYIITYICIYVYTCVYVKSKTKVQHRWCRISDWSYLHAHQCIRVYKSSIMYI